MSNNRYEFSTMTNVDAKDKAAKELLDYVSGNTAAIFSGFDRSDVQYQSDRLVKDRNAKELQKKLEEEEVTKFLMSSRRSEKPAATMQVAMKEKRKGDELSINITRIVPQKRQRNEVVELAVGETLSRPDSAPIKKTSESDNNRVDPVKDSILPNESPKITHLVSELVNYSSDSDS